MIAAVGDGRRRPTRRLIVAIGLALGLGLAGCGAVGHHPVDLAGAWPEPTAPRQPFAKVDRAWTRRAVLRAGFQQVLDVHATLRSPAWRAAWAEREIRVRGLPATEADGVRAAARAAADGDYELTLVVVTYDRAENDLDRGLRSIWRLALIDDAGHETTASEVIRDRRPTDVLRTEVATYGDFAEVYVARFPKAAAVLHPGARRARLKLSSTRGRVILTWHAP